MNYKRVLSGVILFPIMAIIFIFGNTYFVDTLISIIAIMGLYEYYNAFKTKYKYIDEIVNVSEGAKQSFIAKTKILQKKVWSIPNYIDAEEIITKSKKENSFTVDNKKYNLVTVGRICHQKGFDILIEHMKNIVQQNKNVNLYIIGDGPDAPKIKKLVKRKKLQENVFFLGSQKNPFEYMKKMDAFVITSRYEGQGMVILEAKVIGLPIFIPKHLEKYVEGIEGCINIEKDILGAKKIEDKQVNNDFLLKLKNVSLFVVTNSSSVTGLPGLTLFLLREPEVRGTTFKT
mgnify:CR=1 FL=1